VRWRRRRVLVLVAVLAVVGAATGLAAAYVRRISPQWPAVEGEPYAIALDADGCPIVPDQVRFVEAPGQLVPADPVDVVLCTTPPTMAPSIPGYTVEPRVRVLRAGAVDFAALLNGLPDRNADRRQWQRKHSGFWPDAPGKHLSLQFAYPYSFVLRYANRPPVPLIAGRGWTTGARTRIDSSKPHVVDLFLQRLKAQQ
jgi:hypothetical protein